MFAQPLPLGIGLGDRCRAKARIVTHVKEQASRKCAVQSQCGPASPAHLIGGNAGRRWIRDNDPDGWTQAVEFDRAIRHGYPHATDHGQPLRGQYFLHRSCTPLDEVDLDPSVTPKLQLRLAASESEEEADPDGCSP